MEDKNKKTIEAYDQEPKYYARQFDLYGVMKADIDRSFELNKSGNPLVLELGCGNGRDAEYIISKIGKDSYLGVDASAELLKIAQERNPGALFQLKDMRELRFEPGQFGIILAFASLLHVKREDLSLLIEKSSTWLKSGGIFYIFSKYGEYRELEIENIGQLKYYYPYKPEDLEKMAGAGFETVYKIIADTNYGPAFTLALRKK